MERVSTNSPVQQERIKKLNDKPFRKGSFIIYWMQSSQRSEYNHALEYAIATANRSNQPLIVYFGITDKFPEANERHYIFMLEGLKEVKSSIQQRGIAFIIRHESPDAGIIPLAQKASALITDRGYLKIQKAWRAHVASNVHCPVFQVESDVVIPVEQTSTREEYSAATIRPKVQKSLRHFLVPLPEQEVIVSSTDIDLKSLDLENIERAIAALYIDKTVKKTATFRGGTSEAKKRLKEFIATRLDSYFERKNDPGTDYTSKLSPYLHFGQISPLYIALEVSRSRNINKDIYLEELITRRELSLNFVNFNANYDSFEGLPAWAQKTLLQHKDDKREYIYSIEELEKASTHDSYWNAAQREMVITGAMHGYMRMYWCKKIIEWSKSPLDAYRTALYQNNKYELDGRDPNGFTGIAWSFGKHDRPWASRNIFGNIRYMSADGLKRKFDMDSYVARINSL